MYLLNKEDFADIVKDVGFSIPIEEYQKFDFELERLEDSGDSDENIRKKLSSNETFKKIVAIMAIYKNADDKEIRDNRKIRDEIPHFISMRKIIKDVFQQL